MESYKHISAEKKEVGQCRDTAGYNHMSNKTWIFVWKQGEIGREISDVRTSW